MSALETDEIIPEDRVDTASPPPDSAQTSFLQVDQLNVVLSIWKEAEDEKGTILRFIELDGKSSTVKVTTPIVELQSAWTCNALEACQQSLPVSPNSFTFDIKPFQIVTLRIKSKPAVGQSPP